MRAPRRCAISAESHVKSPRLTPPSRWGFVFVPHVAPSYMSNKNDSILGAGSHDVTLPHDARGLGQVFSLHVCGAPP